MNILEVKGINTFYGLSHILHDVSLQVEETLKPIEDLIVHKGKVKRGTVKEGMRPASRSIRIDEGPSP
jgi:ABC-type branched-subunit amino acid transport system ATPase component